jgi:imidazolonepropionase-like amidohydrolase
VPTAITGATLYDGEGARIDNATIVLVDGRVSAVGGADTPIPAGANRIDGAGRWVTPGVIDIHSHLGDYPSPGVEAHADGNEITSPVRPEVWAEHSIWPQDPGFTRALANGGVTTLHVLPGSANSVRRARRDDPQRAGPHLPADALPRRSRSLKMACGENPKRVYGGRNQMPQTRMGNVALMRQTWQRAPNIATVFARTRAAPAISRWKRWSTC